jgi:NitT/TauT family transport system substrate-binding protein
MVRRESQWVLASRARTSKGGVIATATIDDAFHDCVQTPEPCVQALVDANPGLQFDNELTNWKLVTELMSDETSQTKGLGYFDPERMQADYAFTDAYFDIDVPFDIEQAYTSEFLNTDLKMPVVEWSAN